MQNALTGGVLVDTIKSNAPEVVVVDNSMTEKPSPIEKISAQSSPHV